MNAGGDYDQLVAVINRQAGLKPLTRQTKPLAPMTPISRPVTSSVVSPIIKKDSKNQEPLYRRAKMASLMKEVPKIPMVSFGPSATNPTDIYHFDPDGNNSIVSPGSNRNIRLPRVASHQSTSRS